MAITPNSISAITNNLFLGDFPMLWMYKHPLYKYLHAKGPKEDGGDRIQVPVLYAAQNGGFYTDMQQFPGQKKEIITAAYYDWKMSYVEMVYSNSDRIKNAGKAKVKDFIKAMMKNAAETQAYNMTTALYVNGAPSSSDINSLDLICNASANDLGAAAGSGPGVTLGTHSKATYTWWSGVHLDAAEAAAGYDFHSKCLAEVHDGTEYPNIAIEHPKVMHLLMREIVPQQQFGSEKELDVGFAHVRLNKMITIFADKNVPYDTTTHDNNRIWFLNTEHLDLVTHSADNNRLEPFAKMDRQAAWAGYIMNSCELVTDGPRYHICGWGFDCDLESS